MTVDRLQKKSGNRQRHFCRIANNHNIPAVAEYFEAMGIVNKDGAAIYKYLNFNKIDEYA